MSASNASVISVIGGASCTQDQYRDAKRVGQLLAEAGVLLVCGGRGGIMEAACLGAQEAGGVTVGILPGTDPSQGNAHLTIAIPTGIGHARNTIVVLAGQAVIAIGGGYGTLSEIAIALKTGRKVVGLGSWQAVDVQGIPAGIVAAETPEHAVSLAVSFAEGEGVVE